MSFESALEHYAKVYDQQPARRQDLAKAAAAEPRARDAAHFFGLEKSAGVMSEVDKAWSESVRTLLANAVALGRELDRTNFSRDPQVGLALELARQELRSDPIENNAFVAELLDIALDNAMEIAASDVDNKGATPLTDARRALAETSWSISQKREAAVLAAGIKEIQDRPIRNPIEQASVGKGKSLAREVWKTVEPRASFWDRPRAQKFAGKSGDQILRDARELAARINRECSEKLAKIYGGDRLGKRYGSQVMSTAGEQALIFVPIVKVDVAKREVHGIMAEEQPDKADEIFDYATSKPYIAKWAEQFRKDTDGKSLGNVRAMHDKISAGKLISIEFDDVNKRIPVVAKIVDDNEWKKVLEGVYTGFSIGGSYVKRWTDGEFQRYTAQPRELSLVDNPCMYGATFTAIKTDGSRQLSKFAGSR
jgi:hypothetical protein